MNAFVVILLSLGAACAMQLGYQKGQRYTYSYQGEVCHAIPGGSWKTLGLRVKCQVHVDGIKKTEIQITLDNIQVHQTQGNRKDPKQQQEQAVDPKVQAAMQKQLALPVRVCFKAQDGSIKEINAHPKDAEWSLNIKRGLANLFQISPQQDQQQEKYCQQYTTQQESTAVGDCQVSYVINRDNCQSVSKEQVARVTKVINYEKCRQRPEFSLNTFYGQKCEECQQSMGYAPYHRSAGQIDHTLTGSQQSGYIIKRTEAHEQHVITPLSQSGGQVTASARQTLQFLKQDQAGQASTELTKKTSLRFTAENPEKRAREDAQRQQYQSQQAEKCVNEMCKAAKDPTSQQAAQKFTEAVKQLRKCNKETLEKQADKMLARQDQTERKYCLDALSFVGTCEAFQVLKQKIDQKRITKPDELNRVFLGLASAPRPSAFHIDTAWELCNHAEVKKVASCRRHCLLSFGALVNKINENPSLQQDTKAVTACQQHVKEMLAQLANQQTSQEDRLSYIKALGNAGSSQARQKLQEILMDKKQLLHHRVECVWALRRIAQHTREKTFPCLISIFADATECPELRMATFALLVNSNLNFATLQALANTVRREITNPAQGPRSNQVASYVISHLSALAYHNNVLTKKRSMQARMALRLMPRMSFGLGYSKGMRLAQHFEKYQAGFEFEANKFDVPESMLPRNLNARLQFNLLGYKMNAFEFGARIENMDDLVEEVISQVRRRQKRSLWGSVLSWLSEEASDDKQTTGEFEDSSTRRSTRPPTRPSTRVSSRHPGPSTRATSRPTSRPISKQTRSQKQSTQQRSASPLNSDGQTKKRHVSAFLKLHGDEVKFVEFKQDSVEQVAQDLADLLTGKKERIEYADQGIVISKDGVEILQTLEKAFLATYARRMIPTLAGIPLDMLFRSAAAARVIAAAKMSVQPSWMSFWQYQRITGSVEIKPCVNAHAHAWVGAHTPFLQVGVHMNVDASANPDHKADVEINAGKSYNLKYNIPQGQRDIVHIKASTQGFTWQRDPETCEQKQQQISMELNSAHVAQYQKTCTGQDMFGVQLCAEGKVPDLSSQRLQQVPVLPAIAQTQVRVSMAPASDNPTTIECKNQFSKNDEKETQVVGEINCSSQTVKRRIPYKLTYRKAEQKQFEIEAKNLEVQGYEDAMAKVTANFEGLKLEFGRGKPQYQIRALGQIQNQGKMLRLQAQWEELPEQWKNFFYKWKPQIWYAIQQYAWVRRTDQKTKQVAFEFQLTSPMTANLRLKTPDAEAERTELSLPLRVDCLPQSIKDIKGYFYAQCEVQDHSIKVFDQLRYQHNIKGGCPYVLVQEHRQGKQQSRIQLTVKFDQQGQKTVMATIQQRSQQQSQQSQETVQINPDLSILIDGQKQECSQKACQSKQGGATVQKVQTHDGKTQIQLWTKMGLHATIEGQRIQVYASPLLRSRVRGLCGDADGEQWNEYKDPQGQVQQLQKFIQSWQQKC